MLRNINIVVYLPKIGFGLPEPQECFTLLPYMNLLGL